VERRKPDKNGSSEIRRRILNAAAPARLVSDKSAWFGSDGSASSGKEQHREREHHGDGLRQGNHAGNNDGRATSASACAVKGSGGSQTVVCEQQVKQRYGSGRPTRVLW